MLGTNRTMFYLTFCALVAGRVFLIVFMMSGVFGLLLVKLNPKLESALGISLALWSFGALVLSMVSGLVYVLGYFSLRCANCNRQYAWYKRNQPEQYSGDSARSKSARFFWPDELVDKRLKCPHCKVVQTATRSAF